MPSGLETKGPKGRAASGPGPHCGQVTPTHSRLCSGIYSQTAPSLWKTTEIGVSAPPLPRGSSPHPKLPNLGLSEICPCIDDPVAWTTGQRQARLFRQRPRPVGVTILHLCPRGWGLCCSAIFLTAIAFHGHLFFAPSLHCSLLCIFFPEVGKHRVDVSSPVN